MHRLFTIPLVLLISACTRPAQSFDDPSSSRFPRIPGWEFSEEQTVYTRDNLWELIDGAADLFVSYGFEDLRVAEYRSTDARDVRVEVYRHASREMAFGMYAAERSPEFSFVSLGTQGYIEDGLLNFLVGRYYVKIASHTPGKAGRDGMLLVGSALEQQLGEERGWPEALSLFPSKGRISNGEGMTANNFLGYSFFASAYTCRYDSSRGPQAFVMVRATPAEASKLLTRYSLLAGGNAGEDFEGIVTINDPNLGSVGIVKRGRFLGGVLPPSGAPIPHDLMSQLDTMLSGGGGKK